MRWSARDVTGYNEPAHIQHRAQCMLVRFAPVCQRPIGTRNDPLNIPPAPASTHLIYSTTTIAAATTNNNK